MSGTEGGWLDSPGEHVGIVLPKSYVVEFDTGAPPFAGSTDCDSDGFSPPDDCDDDDPSINPAATEICDAHDNNCDGTVNEGNLCGPSNDDCFGATPVTVGPNLVGHFGATPSSIHASGLPAWIDNATPDTACQDVGGSTPPDDLLNDTWYLFTAPSSGTWLFSTCDAATFNTKIAVYSGTCAAPTALACNNNGSGCSGFSSELRANLCGGWTYLLQVGGGLDPLETGTATMTISPDASNLGMPYCPSPPTSASPLGGILTASGNNCIGENSLALSCTGVVNGEFGVFFFGPSQIDVAFGDGRRCVGGTISRLWPPIQASVGEYIHSLDLTTSPASAIIPGSTQNFQCWFRDPTGGPNGFNLSNGLSVAFAP
jgi:hypothetical protein